MYACAFSIRTAGEVFSVSLAQGGPAPRFLRQWCFDYLSAGDLDEVNLTKDDVDDAELFELIQKVVHKKCNQRLVKLALTFSYFACTAVFVFVFVRVRVPYEVLQ